MEKEDSKWKEFIWSNILQRSVKVLTLGINLKEGISTIEKGTEFHCMGFMYHGKIKIQHEDWSNTFQITFTPDDESEDPIIVENALQDDVVLSLSKMSSITTSVVTLLLRNLKLQYNSFPINNQERVKDKIFTEIEYTFLFLSH